MINLLAVAGALIWVRNFVLMFFVLTVIYLALTFMSRLRQQDRLKVEYKKQESEITREDYIDQGMVKYNKSLKAKLILGVYIVPLLALGVLMFLALYE